MLIKNAYLVSADYDHDQRKVYLKFYVPDGETNYLWVDPTGHRPYCFSKEKVEKLRKRLENNRKIVGFVQERKRDPIRDEEIIVTKIVATDPLAIGGAHFSLRNRINAWEADIKYYVNYIIDQSLQVGIPYNITEKSIEPAKFALDEAVQDFIPGVLDQRSEEERERIGEWIERLAAEIPKFRRVAFDLEIHTEEERRLPLAAHATDPIIAVSFRGSDGLKKVLVYDLKKKLKKEDSLGDGFEVDIFRDEKEVVEETLEILQRYPFIITFNGDNFDLPYLYRRALNLGIPREKVPIIIGRRDARVRWGVHLDLYRFFFNKSIKSYAFSNRYEEISLNEVSKSLLGKEKVKLEEHISKIGGKRLVEYSYRDSELTYELSSFNNDLVMRLITIVGRVSNMPLDDVCRLSVSNWIKNRVINIHRVKNFLIPLKEDIRGKGEERYSDPITKGKKYIGAIVVKPSPGVFFDVYVLDFNSLYPSIMKEHNISYETVNCSHRVCRKNVVPNTGNWTCTLGRGIVSEFVGDIRDIRVYVFKKMARSRGLDQRLRQFYDVVQNALKVIINATYGVFGSENFPFYYLPAAESVTMIGRHFFTKTIDKCEELGINVIYGDTDSLFLHKPTEDKMKNLMDWVEREFHLELEVDKVYRYVAFSSRKKNYFGVLEDGVVDVKGLVGKKRNTPDIIQRAFYQALDELRDVKNMNEFERAREKVKDTIFNTEEKIKRRDVSLEELAISTTLGKGIRSYVKTTPQHVKAAMLIQRETNRRVHAGEIVRYVKTKTKPGVKPIEISSIEEIDVKKYIELLRSTFDQLLDAIGLEFEERPEKSYGLERFM